MLHPETTILLCSPSPPPGVQGTQCWAGNDLGEAVAGGEVLGTDCTQEDAYQLHAFTINAEYEGCLKDDLHDRVLPVRLSAWYEADLTASMCAVRAAAAGYNMYGLEFGGQCFAGESGRENTLNTHSMIRLMGLCR